MNNQPTMLPYPNSNVAFGQATEMSKNDIARLNSLYKCCKYGWIECKITGPVLNSPLKSKLTSNYFFQNIAMVKYSQQKERSQFSMQSPMDK